MLEYVSPTEKSLLFILFVIGFDGFFISYDSHKLPRSVLLRRRENVDGNIPDRKGNKAD